MSRFCLFPVLFLLIFCSSISAQLKKGDPQPDLPDGFKALKHPEARVRLNALTILGKAGRTARFVMPMVKKMLLKDPELLVRLKAAETLWKVEQPPVSLVLPVVTRGLKDKEPANCRLALEVVKLMGPRAKDTVPWVRNALLHKDFNVQYQAIQAAAAIGPSAKRAVPELLEIIRKDDTGFLAANVTFALGKIGSRGVPALIRALEDKEAKVRRAATFGLGQVGPRAYEAVPALVKTMEEDADSLVQSFAAEALGNIGPEARSAIPNLKKALKSKNEELAINSALALWKIEKDLSGITVLGNAVESGRTILVRRTAARALAEIGSQAKDAIPSLIIGLKDKESMVRADCALALGKMGSSARPAIQYLKPALQDKSVRVSLEAAGAIWRIKKIAPESIIATLNRGLEDKSTNNKVLAAVLVAEIGPPAIGTQKKLLQMMQTQDERVKNAARTALTQLNKESGNK